MDVEQLSDLKLMTPSLDGVVGLWSRVAPLLSPLVCKGRVPTGVNLNRYSGSGDHVSLGTAITNPCSVPPNKPKLIVSMSLGHSVVFQGSSRVG